MLVLGIDAGGSKTIFSMCDEHGNVFARLQRESFQLTSMNAAQLSATLCAAVDALLRRVNATNMRIDAVCAGMPFSGESERIDEIVREAFTESFPDAKQQIVNDAQIAWAGSFALKPGINIVCGTGTIAFGMDAHGNTARCGGWSQQFGDEGSGYWLGRKLMELFCKQADGRLEKQGVLYHIVKSYFNIDNDHQLIKTAEQQYGSNRKKLASLQMLLMEAANNSDADAIACYRQAAYEIALNVKGILEQLDMEKPANVSYSGGIFKAGELLLDPFREHVEAFGGRLIQPIAPPWIGALMMGLRLLGGDAVAVDRLIAWQKQKIVEE